MESELIEKLRKEYEKEEQGHVLKYYNELKEEEKEELIKQLNEINPSRVNKIFKKSNENLNNNNKQEEINFEPPPKESLESIILKKSEDEQNYNKKIKEKMNEWNKKGLKLIKEEKVGILLLAGGQGTRLGSQEPKGCFNLNLLSQKTLFQIQAEKIISLKNLTGGFTKIPWYVMTSGPTRKPTEEFFRKMNFFGLEEEDVIFFDQGVLPALTPGGKIFLETRSKVSVAPDGNGGIYAAIRSQRTCSAGHSVLEDLEKRGINYIHAYCVDNCLVKVADPIFIGYCVEKKVPCGVKVVVKSKPDESVGVLALKNKLWSVVEYSEMPESISSSKDSNGELKFKSANIANHFYTYDFLKSIESLENQLSYHIANKKISHIDLNTNQIIKPIKPNGIKLELFIFDVFPFLNSLCLLEVDRIEEFSPLKNAPNTGIDDPQTSRRDLLAQHKRWLKNSGCLIDENVEVEISPLVSYSGEGLEFTNGKKIQKSIYIKSKNDLENI